MLRHGAGEMHHMPETGEKAGRGVVTEHLEHLTGALGIPAVRGEDGGAAGRVTLAVRAVDCGRCRITDDSKVLSHRVVMHADDPADAPERPSVLSQPRHEVSPLGTGQVPPGKVERQGMGELVLLGCEQPDYTGEVSNSDTFGTQFAPSSDPVVAVDDLTGLVHLDGHEDTVSGDVGFEC